MISDPASASIYTDFQGLLRLKAAAGKHSPEAKREVARQFEAMFVQMMLKSMRDASPGGGLFDSDQVGFYRDLYDRQLAQELVKGRGLGIADMLFRQMDARPGGGAVAAANPAPGPGAPLLRQPAVRPLLPAANQMPLVVLDEPGAPRPLIDLKAPATPAAADWRPGNPAEFIRDLWPHAQRGAAELGVDPGVLVAQAALESGWGRHLIRFPDGRNSYNLFGIKAGPGWEGGRVTVPTLEYEDGVARRQRASFRAYESIAAAVDDYVDFIRSNPRYRPALEHAGDPQTYLQGLKDAGYATDPDYVEKIRSILRQGSFDNQISELKFSADLPLS